MLPGFASHGSGFHLGAGCQKWKLLDVSGTQTPLCETVVNGAHKESPYCTTLSSDGLSVYFLNITLCTVN